MGARRVLVLSVLGLALVACGPPAEAPPAAPGTWHLVGEGARVRLEGELALYEQPGREHFFVRLRVTNLGERPLGLDLRDGWRVPRPNQWGGLRGPQREEISERRVQVLPATAAAEEDLRQAFRDGHLDGVPAAAATDLYVEFNASGRSDVDAVDQPWVYVSLDGRLLVTDGVEVEDLSLAWDDGDEGSTSLVMRTPVRWGRIPDGATVLTIP